MSVWTGCCAGAWLARAVWRACFRLRPKDAPAATMASDRATAMPKVVTRAMIVSFRDCMGMDIGLAPRVLCCLRRLLKPLCNARINAVN